MIKFNCRGRILKGEYSPNGEITLEDDTEETGGYYIYIWPNDGTKWPESNDDMVYDCWFESLDRVKNHFKNRNWEIEWKEDKNGPKSNN